MREQWCAARQAFIANPGANESSLPPAMADSLYPPRCVSCQWSLAAHGAACLCASASNSSACWRKCCEPPTAAVREPSIAVVLQTHGTVTQGLLARIRIAKEQLATHGIRFFVGAGHQSFCETRAPSLCRAWGMDWCRHSNLRTRRPDLLSREFGCCNVVTVARAFELGAKWEATPATERGVGQFIHRLRRDAA